MALLLHYTTTKLQELYFIHITIFTRKSIHQSSNKYVELPHKLNKVPWYLGSSIQVKINFRRQLTSLVPLFCFCFYLRINVIHCSCVVIAKLNKLQLARFVDGVFFTNTNSEVKWNIFETSAQLFSSNQIPKVRKKFTLFINSKLPSNRQVKLCVHFYW